MAYISFEHKKNISRKGKRTLFSLGSGGDFVHCEIVLPEYGNYICSSWYPKGIEIRPWRTRENPGLWTSFDLGSCDKIIHDFFWHRQDTKYSVRGLAINMVMNSNMKNTNSFCSQICYEAMKSTGFYKLPEHNPYHLSPNDLYNIVKSSNFTIINPHTQQWH